VGLRHNLRVGPAFQSVQVENTPERFIARWRDEGGPDADVFGTQQYGGLKLSHTYDSRTTVPAPTRGLFWHSEYQLLRRLDARARPLSQLSSAVAGYWTPWPRLTLATRLGSTVNFGRYAFFQAATLGGLENLRGYRRTRFAGENSLYHNAEARVHVLRIQTLLFTGDLGLLAFHDTGRVWLSGETSNEWHTGYGGGMWLKPMNRLVLSAMYGVSDEDRLPLIRLGFFF
jgi:outer membrane translocation and assembly module TamA